MRTGVLPVAIEDGVGAAGDDDPAQGGGAGTMLNGKTGGWGVAERGAEGPLDAVAKPGRPALVAATARLLAPGAARAAPRAGLLRLDGWARRSWV